MGYVYIFLTIVFTVYGQLILKWRTNQKGELPLAFFDKVKFIITLYYDLWIISGFIAAVLAGVCWMLAMTKFELSYAYPFMSLSFVLVFLLSVFLYGETVTAPKVVGLAFIIVGIIITTRSM